MEQPARRRFYKIAKGLLYRISLCGSPFFSARPVCTGIDFYGLNLAKAFTPWGEGGCERSE